jgi:hypothetical protein
VGKYKVSVDYDKKQIGDKKDVIAKYPEIDLKNSKLYINKGDNKGLLISPDVKQILATKKYAKLINSSSILKMERKLIFMTNH